MPGEKRGATMRVRLRYFALVRETLGRDEESREIATGTTAGALYDAVAADHPRLVGMKPATAS
jgi:molybdopterin converting factor small subunit